MRGMRFRAWDTLNNKYFENTHEAYKGNLEILQIGLNGRLQLINSLERRDESLFPERFIIQQYTGLKDVNGADIFEGDIVTLKEEVSGYEEPNKIVVFHKGSFGWRDNEIGFVPFSILDRPKESIEVIGNIYEHHDLLGDSQ